MPVMTPVIEYSSEPLVQQLLALPDFGAQKKFLVEHASCFDEKAARSLKEQADRLMRSDVRAALNLAHLLAALSDLTGQPIPRALGLVVEANVLSVGGLGDYQRAVELYDQVVQIYRQQGRVVEEARTLIGKIYSLTFLGRYAEALEAGQWASRVLEAQEQWQLVANLNWNLAVLYGRQGEDKKALSRFDGVRAFYQQLGAEGEWILPMIEQNRAIVLRNLGQFEASIQASQRAWATLTRLGQSAEAGRAQQNLAFTYFVLGRYNRALELLDQASTIFLADGRQSDALVVELYITDCLLQLRRFTDVLEKCQRIRSLFARSGARLEIAQALLNEATAFAGLQRFEQALTSLMDARNLFEQEGNQTWLASADLEKAAVLFWQGNFAESLAVSQSCAAIFQEHNLPVKEAQACLAAARAALALGQVDLAHHLAGAVLRTGETKDIPALIYQARHLLGNLFTRREQFQLALKEYEQAIQMLERLRGNMMVEFRAEFLEDKQIVYEDMVDLCLRLNQSVQALAYAERAKSRVLLDLLAFRVDLSIQARGTNDTPWVEALTRLRQERDRLYRRWEGQAEFGLNSGAPVGYPPGEEQQKIAAIEKEITELWHKLLIHNADYARDADLWQMRMEPVQEHLPVDTVLLEYYVVHGQFVAFLVTPERVQTYRLALTANQVKRLLHLFNMNLKAVLRSTPVQIPNLTQNAIGLLQQLYRLLVAPLAAALPAAAQLVIVPHGPLHYLPFHALHDGQAYLLERYAISYLPGAHLLRYCVPPPLATTRMMAFGHSPNGKLPYAVQEAEAVAKLCAGETILGNEATLARLRAEAADCRILHLATHGDFRADNPLFSGLTLADGWLTTLDIFSLRLQASLVTLSACQTGRHVIGGGDELLGLMRAFLYAGTSSLVSSLWSVEDRSTAQIMAAFYRKLQDGWSKGEALRFAQLGLLNGTNGDLAENAHLYAHPYFWAPFFLVGHAGTL